MTCDPERWRAESHASWDAAAAGWRRRAPQVATISAPVSQWMVAAIGPQPGHRVLDLAAGVGETGFLAAELIAPGGTLICSDQSEKMLSAARERAAELGLDNVEFKPIDAEWIDLPLASLDSVLCRWGFMLMVDPGAALRETRRVLRPGGRLALAVWATRTRNPWVAIMGDVLGQARPAPPPDPGAPGMFALADPVRLEGLLEEAGFEDTEIEALAFDQHYLHLDHYWDTQLDLSVASARLVGELSDQEIVACRERLRLGLEPYVLGDGSVRVPACCLVAAAGA